MIEKRRVVNEVEKILRHIDEIIACHTNEKKGKALEKNVNKHKLDADLKREIKKLQNYQTEITSWLGESEVKDKSLNKILKKSLDSIESRLREIESNETLSHVLENSAEENEQKKKSLESHHQWIGDILTNFEKIVQAETNTVGTVKSQQKTAKVAEESPIDPFNAQEGFQYKYHIEKLKKLDKMLDQENVNMTQLERLRDYLFMVSQGNHPIDESFEKTIYESLMCQDNPSTFRTTSLEMSSHSIRTTSGLGVTAETTANMRKKTDKVISEDSAAALTNNVLQCSDTSQTDSGQNICSSGDIEYTDGIPRTSQEASEHQKDAIVPNSPLENNTERDSTNEQPQKKSTEGRVDLPLLTSIVEQAYQDLPNNVLRQRARYFQSRTIWPTPPSSFPAFPLKNHATPEFFQKLDLDTLFFIFYYQQGTYQQLLASRRLKQNNWMFHNKYLTWFLLQSDPKSANDPFQRGTYIYFDSISGWCTRIKHDFHFDLADIETEIPPAKPYESQ